MDQYLDLVEYPDTDINITEYHPEYTLLNDRTEKSSSCVWKYFSTLKHNECIDRKHVYCVQCFFNRKIQKYHRSTSTGNLRKHLRKYHRISLNQTFRIRKESDSKTIVSIQKEQSPNDLDDDNLNGVCVDGDGEEFLIHDINEILIAEVAKRPLLYNSAACQTEKGFKHQTRRQLWNEIYEALNQLIPYPRLPKIWKNIRDRYHKVRRSMESAPDNQRPKYRYYDMLRFLDDAKGDQETVEEFESYVDEFFSSTENAEFERVDVPGVEPVVPVVESYEPKAKKVRKSNNTASPMCAQNMKRETLSTLVSEIIEEPATHVFVKESSIEIISEPEAKPNLTHTLMVTQQMHSLEAANANNIETVCSNAEQVSKSPTTAKKQDQFDIFGNFMAEVMRNMTNSQSRKLQLGIVRLISEVENAE